MDKLSVKHHMEKILTNKDVSKNENITTWTTTIAVKIIDFIDHVSYYKNFASVNLMNTFLSTTILLGKENSNFINAHVRSDEVVMIFTAETKTKIGENYETSIAINSAINVLLPKLTKTYMYNKPLEVGIGIWTSNHDSKIKYEPESISKESITLMGNSIHHALLLASLANKDQRKQILMNHLTYKNIPKSNKSITENWLTQIELSETGTKLPRTPIYESPVRYTEFETL